MKRNLLIGCVFFVIVASNSVLSQVKGKDYQGKIGNTKARQVFILNKGWEYAEDNAKFPEDVTDKLWQHVDLPHTWNAFDPTDDLPGYRRDASWYRKDLFIPRYPEEYRWLLYFEGVNIKSEVIVNGQKAGSHVGGFVGFSIDITPYIKAEMVNTILVRADNAADVDVIPSQQSDFVIYGGITRDVWLKVLPPVYIDKLAVSTPELNSSSGNVQVALTLNNNLKNAVYADLKVTLWDPANRKITSKKANVQVNRISETFEFELNNIIFPALWSPTYPNLYEVDVSVSLGDFVDKHTAKFGFRWFEFKDYGAFYLNGKRLLLQGTQRHEEWAGLGSAMPNKLHRRDIKMIKNMGANFVCLAHSPQDPAVYRACDELGLLVCDDLPWYHGGLGSGEWKENTKRLLMEQIRQNYNHPSIILWSLGNEIHLLSDMAGGDDSELLEDFLIELNDLSHELDPYRLTTIRKFNAGSDIIDVYSPTINAGWYSGGYRTYEKALIKTRKKYPRFIHGEYGGASHVGRHTENPITGEGRVRENDGDKKSNMVQINKTPFEGDWNENYIVDLYDWYLSVSENAEWLTGSTQRAFKDFSTSLGSDNPIPYMNQNGLVDREGKPKDAYYVFKSYWTTDPAFVYIESHTWKERFGKRDEEKQVCVFSNCKKVKLELNGIDLGTKTKDLSSFPASGLHWDLTFAEGPNQLIATGYSKSKKVAQDTVNLSYYVKMSGQPAKILLSVIPDGKKKILIEAKVVDKNGQICPDYKERVYFDLNGGGRLSKYLGTPTGSNIIEFASGRAYIIFYPEPGKSSVIEARTQDFKGSYYTYP